MGQGLSPCRSREEKLEDCPERDAGRAPPMEGPRRPLDGTTPREAETRSCKKPTRKGFVAPNEIMPHASSRAVRFLANVLMIVCCTCGPCGNLQLTLVIATDLRDDFRLPVLKVVQGGNVGAGLGNTQTTTPHTAMP